MNVDIKKIEEEVFSLSSRERARLAMDLIKRKRRKGILHFSDSWNEKCCKKTGCLENRAFLE